MMRRMRSPPPRCKGLMMPPLLSREAAFHGRRIGAEPLPWPGWVCWRRLRASAYFTFMVLFGSVVTGLEKIRR
jgi:hypothetical protein